MAVIRFGPEFLSNSAFLALLFHVERCLPYNKGSDRVSYKWVTNGIRKRGGGWLRGGSGLSDRANITGNQELKRLGLLTITPHSSAIRGNEQNEYAVQFGAIRDFFERKLKETTLGQRVQRGAGATTAGGRLQRVRNNQSRSSSEKRFIKALSFQSGDAGPAQGTRLVDEIQGRGTEPSVIEGLDDDDRSLLSAEKVEPNARDERRYASLPESLPLRGDQNRCTPTSGPDNRANCEDGNPSAEKVELNARNEQWRESTPELSPMRGSQNPRENCASTNGADTGADASLTIEQARGQAERLIGNLQFTSRKNLPEIAKHLMKLCPTEGWAAKLTVRFCTCDVGNMHGMVEWTEMRLSRFSIQDQERIRAALAKIGRQIRN